MKSIITLIALTILFSSCEKIISLDVSNSSEKLVIEGNVTNEPGPYFVKLTQTVNFNAPNIYPPVNNAVVIISDNAGQIDTLSYTNNGLYQTHNLKGIEGRTYYLKVIIKGKDFTAQSTMPQNVKFDSIRLSNFELNGEGRTNVIPVYKDPEMLGNNYRFIQTINNKLDITFYAFNDNLNNGLVNQRPLISNDPDQKLKTGDTVKIEMQCISKQAYDYYFALSEQVGGGFGGGTTPANPPNNIIGDALGIFSAYTTQSKKVIIP